MNVSGLACETASALAARVVSSGGHSQGGTGCKGRAGRAGPAGRHRAGQMAGQVLTVLLELPTAQHLAT